MVLGLPTRSEPADFTVPLAVLLDPWISGGKSTDMGLVAVTPLPLPLSFFRSVLILGAFGRTD